MGITSNATSNLCYLKKKKIYDENISKVEASISVTYADEMKMLQLLLLKAMKTMIKWVEIRSHKDIYQWVPVV